MPPGHQDGHNGRARKGHGSANIVVVVSAKHMTRQAVDAALRKACAELEVIGASTHSLRRSALTAASDKGVPLRVLQSISGHSSLEMLQRYLDVKDEAKRAAALAFG